MSSVPQQPGRLADVEEISAGGLVIDARPDSTVCGALIGRLDRQGRLLWSLPKGHVEPGETAEAAAIREIREETGILGRVVAPLGTIDYRFVTGGRGVIHKTVYQYLLVAEGGQLSDADIEVTEVAWVPLGELSERLAYLDERDLVTRIPELCTALP